MSVNPSELNDLASVDVMFAEIMAESGVNPIPTVCDGCDMSILEQDNKTVGSALKERKQTFKFLFPLLTCQWICKTKTASLELLTTFAKNNKSSPTQNKTSKIQIIILLSSTPTSKKFKTNLVSISTAQK